MSINEVINMLEPKVIEAAVVQYIKAIEPSYQVLANVDLKLAEFTQTISPGNNLGASLSNNAQGQVNSVHCRLPKTQLPKFSGIQGTH